MVIGFINIEGMIQYFLSAANRCHREATSASGLADAICSDGEFATSRPVLKWKFTALGFDSRGYILSLLVLPTGPLQHCLAREAIHI